MPAIFGDRMVVQQDAKIPVWGWADPGELIQVSLGQEQKQTQANAQGDWRVEFDSMPATTPPMTLAVGGRNAIEFHDIAVGEVWLVSGDASDQSHLIDESNGRDLVAQPADPNLRFYEAEPRPGIRPKSLGGGYWHPAAMPWIQNTGVCAYFFGQQLHQSLNRPVGIIVAAYGQFPIQGWMSKEALQKLPDADKWLADIVARDAIFPRDPIQQKAAMDDWGKRLNNWDQNQRHPWMAAEAGWAKARDAAIAAKQPIPPEPQSLPPPPRNPDGEPGDPTVLFNGIIAPLVGFPVRGIVWDQGQANISDAQQYKAILSGLIHDWRGHWHTNVPFLAVAANVPHSSSVQAIDPGPINTFHPPDKPALAKHLAAASLHAVYGQ